MKKERKQELMVRHKYDLLWNHLSHLKTTRFPGGTRALDHLREAERANYILPSGTLQKERPCQALDTEVPRDLLGKEKGDSILHMVETCSVWSMMLMVNCS